MNRRASAALQRAGLSQIPAVPAGGLLGLIVLCAVGVVSDWWNKPPSRETWMAWMRLLVAFLCSGLVGWLVASESPYLPEALVVLTLALALSLGLLS
jgi:hypothetical protein